MDVVIGTLLVVGLTGVVWHRHWELSHLQLVRRTRRHGGMLELRRRVSLERAGSCEFPQPREERVITWRLGGVPVMIQRSQVGLPLQVDACMDTLPADAFDGHFSPQFRLDASAPRM